MQNDRPSIDFTKIAFPTDSLTIAQLRKVEPDAFDIEPTHPNRINFARNSVYLRGDLGDILSAIIDLERLLADIAFRKEAGLPQMECGQNRAELIDVLASDYKSLGVSKGKHESRELLKGIEAQAREQARELGGRPR